MSRHSCGDDSRRFPESPAGQSLSEKSGLTAPCGRGSLSATHGIGGLASRDQRERWMFEVFAQTRQRGGEPARRAH